jgi:restriction system protein
MVRALIVTGGNYLALRPEDVPLSPLTADEARRFLRLSTRSILPETLAADMIIRSKCFPAALQALARLIENSMLPNIDGHLYEIKRAEESRIIQAVRPQIITFSSTLAEQLKRTPEKMYQIQSREFEELIAELLHDQGFEVELTKATRDGGRDILARMHTKAFKFLCLIEAKKHSKDRPVGVQLVRNLYGTFCDEQANSAMLVTTSYFTQEAKRFSERHEYHLSLRDYTDVVGWLSDYKSMKRP